MEQDNSITQVEENTFNTCHNFNFNYSATVSAAALVQWYATDLLSEVRVTAPPVPV